MTDVQATLDERGARYGDFSDHALIAQRLQDDMRRAAMVTSDGEVTGVGWRRLSAVQKQALTVIADKIARILSGDPNYGDNWHDIQGYARLAEERLPKPPATPSDALPGEDFIGGWYSWDCHQPEPDKGPAVPDGYKVAAIKLAGGQVSVFSGSWLWNAAPYPAERIVTYRVERA